MLDDKAGRTEVEMKGRLEDERTPGEPTTVDGVTAGVNIVEGVIGLDGIVEGVIAGLLGGIPPGLAGLLAGLVAGLPAGPLLPGLPAGLPSGLLGLLEIGENAVMPDELKDTPLKAVLLPPA